MDNTDAMLTHSDFSFQERLVAKAENLARKYSNWDRVYLYHVLSGSNIKDGAVIEAFDFPGDDSIVAFLKNEENPRPKSLVANA